MIRSIQSVGSPWALLNDLAGWQDEFSRHFGGRFAGQSFAGGAQPSLNVWQSPDGLIVDVDVPGVAPEDVDVSVENGTLTISGKRVATEQAEGLQRRERAEGTFSQSLQLPFRVNPEQVKASYRHGVLRVELPRAEADKPKRIAVSVA